MTASKKRKITLQKIIGTTTECGHQFAVSRPVIGDAASYYAYATGACITITNHVSNKQLKFLVTKSEISCISSFFMEIDKEGGKMPLLLSGESSGQLTCWLWPKKRKLFQVKKAHKGKILACEMDPTMQKCVTIGEDSMVRVWNLSDLVENSSVTDGSASSSSRLVAQSKIAVRKSTPNGDSIDVHSLVWSPDSSFFVTSGTRFVKYWPLSNIKHSAKNRFKSANVPLIEGKKMLLCDVEKGDFVSMSMASNDSSVVYAVTKNSILCIFGVKQRSLLKWVNLKAKKAHSIHVTDKHIICGCSEGIIRLFEPKTLAYQGTLPKPPPIHSNLTSASINENIFVGAKKDGGAAKDSLADALVCQATPDSQYICAMYDDRSFIMWNISNGLKKVSKYRSFLSHSSCIWDIDMLPEDGDGPLPDGTFVTCSEDNTMRFWNVNPNDNSGGSSHQDGLRGSIAEKSIFSRDLLHVVTMPKIPNPGNGPTGLRCCKFTPNGCHVVSGDRQGFVRVHDVYQFNTLSDQCAHDAEVLSVDAAQFENDSILLASGSRDNLIHLYDLSEGAGTELVDTLSDHSASITSVKFASSGAKLLSCSADKTIVFRNVSSQGDAHYLVDQANRAQIPNGKIYAMDTDATQKYIITSGSDKKLHIWNIRSGRSIRNYKTDKKSEPLKVRTDPAGIHAVTSSSDKILRLYDFYSGACYAKFRGHSGVITGLKFTNDCEHIISVGSDGCIFIWKLADDLKKAMRVRMSEIKERKRKIKKSQEALTTVPRQSQQKTKLDATLPGSDKTGNEEDAVALIFRDTQLPSWARPKTDQANTGNIAPSRPKTSPAPNANADGGVWAQRIASNIALRPNTASNDDVEPLHHSKSSAGSKLSSTAKEQLEFYASAAMEENDDVNLSEADSDSDKDDRPNTPFEDDDEDDDDQKSTKDSKDDEQEVFFENEEDKEKFDVASVNKEDDSYKEKQAELDKQEDEEAVGSLEPVDDDVEFPESDQDEAEVENKKFVRENYGNLDKMPQRSSVRESFSSNFIRKSLANARNMNKQSDHSVIAPKERSVPQVQELGADTDEEKEPTPKKANTQDDSSSFKESTNKQAQASDISNPISPNSDPGQLALEAGYGRVSNDTFADNFRKVAGALSPPPTPPQDDSTESEDSEKPNKGSPVDELRFLRKKYKIPKGLQMSAKTQKAKSEASQGLEEYMKRRKEEEQDGDEKDSEQKLSNEQSSSEEKGGEEIPQTIETTETTEQSTGEDKEEKEDKEESPSKQSSNAQNSISPEKENSEQDSQPRTSLSQKESTSTPSKQSTTGEESSSTQENSPHRSPATTSDTSSKQEEHALTPTKPNNQVHFAQGNDASENLPLPPKTPDVGQYANLNQNESIQAPRAMHAVTPMPTQQKPRTNKPVGSIVLRNSVDEYNQAMENLRSSFKAALDMYDEANTNLQRSRAAMQIPEEEERSVTSLLEQFEGVFRQMNQSISQRDPTRNSMSMSNQNVDLTLDKYSDMLVSMVAEKMKKRNNSSE